MPLKEIFEAGLIVQFRVGEETKPINIFSTSDNPETQREIDAAFNAVVSGSVKEFSSENILFLCAVYNLYKEKERNGGKEPTTEMLKELYDTYITPSTVGGVPGNSTIGTVPGATNSTSDMVSGAVKTVKTQPLPEVNISSGLATPLAKIFADGNYDPSAPPRGLSLELFADATKEIRNVIQKDTIRGRLKEVTHLPDSESVQLVPPNRLVRAGAAIKAFFSPLTNALKGAFGKPVAEASQQNAKSNAIGAFFSSILRKLQGRGRRSVHPAEEVAEQNALPNATSPTTFPVKPAQGSPVSAPASIFSKQLSKLYEAATAQPQTAPDSVKPPPGPPFASLRETTQGATATSLQQQATNASNTAPTMDPVSNKKQVAEVNPDEKPKKPEKRAKINPS